MQIVKRGGDIGFFTTFTDTTGAAYTPGAATLRVAYPVGNDIVTTEMPMTLSAGQWIAKWNSSVADAGQVDWFVSTNGPDLPVDQGSFRLTKNAANPDP